MWRQRLDQKSEFGRLVGDENYIDQLFWLILQKVRQREGYRIALFFGSTSVSENQGELRTEMLSRRSQMLKPFHKVDRGHNTSQMLTRERSDVLPAFVVRRVFS